MITQACKSKETNCSVLLKISLSYFFLTSIGGELLYNVVLVSAI